MKSTAEALNVVHLRIQSNFVSNSFFSNRITISDSRNTCFYLSIDKCGNVYYAKISSDQSFWLGNFNNSIYDD